MLQPPCRLVLFTWYVIIRETVIASPSNRYNQHATRLPGKSFEHTWDESGDMVGNGQDMTSNGRSWMGAGREFDLFHSNGLPSNDIGTEINRSSNRDIIGSESENLEQLPRERTKGKFRRPSSPLASMSRSIPIKHDTMNTKSSSRTKPVVFQTVQDWWTTSITPNVKNWPKIQCRIEPSTSIKLRKTFRPLKTIIRLGADFNGTLCYNCYNSISTCYT